MGELVIRAGELHREDVQALLALHVSAMQSFSPPDACHVLAAGHLDHPSIMFFSARNGGRLLGVGALKEISSDHGEVKSMRTAPEALGQGVGWAILSHIIAVARSRRYSRLSLETGSGSEFEAALSLYERAGFRPTSPFGGYSASPFTRFLALDL